MTTTWVGRRPLALQALLLVVVVALLALPAFAPSEAYAGWPALGFSVALLLSVERHRRWATTALLTLVSTPALALSYGVPLYLGVVGALALTLSSLFVASFLLAGRHTGPGRLVEIDGARFLAVTLAGALLNSLLPMVLALSAGDLAEAASVTLSTALAVLTAQLVVLPLFLRTTDRPATAGPGERMTQRVVLLAVVVAAFWVSTSASPAFLVLPAVGWAAVRATQRETHLQVFVVGVTAYALTVAGRGPFVDPTPAQLPDGLMSAQIYVYLLALCYGTVPLALTVDRLFTMTGQATRAATTIERLLDSAGGTLFIATDAVGRMTHYNTGAQQTLGYRPEEVLGLSPQMFHTDEEVRRHAVDMGVADSYLEVVLEMVRRGDQRDWEFVHQDGSRKITSLTLSTVADADGRPAGYIATGEDVTERMRAQEALVTALDREHASVLRLQEVDDVKQELVSNVSHELRTPITSIAGYTELLGDGSLGDLNDEQLGAVRRIGRNTSRLGLLVEDLLTLSRAESGKLDLESTPVDLRHVVGESLDLLGEAIRTGSRELDLDLGDRPVTVLGDAHALERVVTNLIGNALKFTPDDGRVSVALSTAASEGDAGDGAPVVRLVVADTGMGISLEDQEHLFTRFFRASAATTHAIQGTGLGLSIVHSIVTQHGGDVIVDSASGRGTTVTVTLPAYADR